MKRLALFSVWLITATPYLAQAQGGGGFDYTDTARVISARPVYERTGHPKRECWDEEVSERESRGSNGERGLGGTIIGGIAGGLIGNQVGRGNGRTAATAVGAVTGAVVGDHIENDDRDRGDHYSTHTIQRCRDIEDVHEEVHGYDVKYKFNGRTFTTRMKHDPGNTIRLGITVLDQ